jgi:excisionase family DNA binding protein
MRESLTVSAKEAAHRLGIGLTTTYKLLRLGRLPAVRVGTRPNFRVPVRAIEEALAEPERLSLGGDGEGERRIEQSNPRAPHDRNHERGQ